MNAWLTHKVLSLFAQRVLDVTKDVLFKWRLLVEKAGNQDTRSRGPICSSRRRRYTME